MLFAPCISRLCNCLRKQRGTKCPRRKHYSNEPSVPDNIDTPQGRDVLEKAAEIVLRVTRRDSFCHLAILAKISEFSQPRGPAPRPTVRRLRTPHVTY